MRRRLVLAGEQVRPIETVDEHTARVVLSGTCWRKRRYDEQRQATLDALAVSARTRTVVTVYRCPFSSLSSVHWHIGHPPAHPVVVLLAMVMRWCNAHPDLVPAPPDGTA
mgnify:CR=1 FL=1